MADTASPLVPLAKAYYWEACRSVTILVVLSVATVWAADVRSAVLFGSAVGGLVLVGVWSHLAHPHPEAEALDHARPLATPPTIQSTSATGIRVFSRAPVAIGVSAGVLAGCHAVSASSVEPVLSAATALLSGLAYTRLRRARTIRAWEETNGETAFVAGTTTSGTRWRLSREGNAM